MLTYKEASTDAGIRDDYHIIEPTLDEIASEWNQNVSERAHELSANIDNTYLKVITPNILDALNKYVPLGAKVLDLGCGLGHLTNLISKNNYDVIGIDVAEKAIDYAKTSFSNTKFEHASILDFSLKNKTLFDVCIANMVLHNLVEIEKNLFAINRMLRTGGYVIASIPNPELWFNSHPNINKEYFFEYDTDNVYKIPFKIRLGAIHPSPITYIHRPIFQYTQLIKHAGFKVIVSENPSLQNGKQDKDLLFCIWQKQ